MNDTEFESRADAVLERVAQSLEECGIDCDAAFKGGGVLEIELAGGARVVVNRHAAAREIWVAAKSGGHHFRPHGDRWSDTRDGVELFERLSAILGELTGAAVSLRP
ncbi:MAG: iron donor protein CyaY [Burkholderiales bacterium]|nr:iron donor protein CyaY [Burkholderiales bacterium]